MILVQDQKAKFFMIGQDMNNLILELKAISKLYGASLIVNKKQHYAAYLKNGKMELGVKNKNRIEIIKDFCHLLGSFISHSKQEYWFYNDKKGLSKIVSELGSREDAAHYSLYAEINNDNQAKKIAKKWFPKIKYINKYSRNRVFYEGFFSAMWDC